MRCEELPWRSPGAFLAQYGDVPWSVLLDSGGDTGERSRWSYFCCHPTATITCDPLTEWERLQQILPPRVPAGPLPFSGGLVGLASYEAGLRLEGITSRHRSIIPPLQIAHYSGTFAFDRQEKRLYWSSYNDTPMPVDLPSCSLPRLPLPRLSFTPDLDEVAYCNGVSDVIQHILEGDIFQANLTTQFRASLDNHISPSGLYRHLRHRSPAPFGAFFNLPAHALLSASVERFLSMDFLNRVETRPIKGTAPLGYSPEENHLIATHLANDEKEYAENLMITDLMRNDIGRVSVIGSVEVPTLCAVERFAHVHHLVSSVTSLLKPELTSLDLLRVTLPPGSVTGAPKNKALTIIDMIERSARGAYCGSLFRIGADGSLDSSVIIRSLLLRPKELSLGVGCGITALSNPQKEWHELCLKAAPLLELFTP